MKKIEEKVIWFVDENQLIQAGDKLLIGLSGGPDSVFAIHFFSKFKQRFKVNLSAVHINHKIRGVDADKDEQFSRKLCDSLGIEFVSQEVDIPALKTKSKKSVEEIAREERYKIFLKTAEEFGADKIITAHNQNDNTETVLLNLIKGTGVKGLSGIPVKRGKIIRPLLCVSKEEILEYLWQNKIRYRIDKSNLESDYQRNFLRHKVIPKLAEINPSLDQGVFRTSRNLSLVSKELETVTQNLAKKFWSKYRGNVVLKTNLLWDFDSGIISEIIKTGLQKYYDSKTTSADIDKIRKLIKSQVGKEVQLRNKFKAVRERNKILLLQPAEETFSISRSIKVGESLRLGNESIKVERASNKSKFQNRKDVEYVSIDDRNPVFRVRNWKIGDRFKPLGMKNYKKVSDFLTDIKVPASERKNQLILEYRNKIVWILGLRIDDRFKLTSKSKQVYRICLK